MNQTDIDNRHSLTFWRLSPTWTALKRANMWAVCFGCTVIVAVWLRWAGLDSQSLWSDEGYTLWISRFSPAEIWHALNVDTSTPLYYVLLHYWTGYFGTTDVALRALSALFPTLSLPVFCVVVWRVLADKTALLLATMLYALSFLQIWYAKEARCYALLSLLSLGSVYCLLLWLERPTHTRFCGAVFCLAATLYTHNMALFYLPGFAIASLTYPGREGARARIRDAFLVLASALLLYVPWLPTLWRQLRAVNHEFWAATPKVGDLIQSLCVLSGFDARTFQLLVRDRFHTGRMFGFWTWAPAFLAIFAICLAGGLFNVRSPKRRKLTALLAFSITPLVLVFAVSRFFTPVYIDRIFLAPSALLPIVLCAPMAFQAGARRKTFQLIGLLVVATSCVSSIGYLHREAREDWRGLTQYLVRLQNERRLVVVVPDIDQVLVRHYASSTFDSDGRPFDVSGFLVRFDPPDPNLQVRILEHYGKADVHAVLEQAASSGKYEEIDIAMPPTAVTFAWVKPAVEDLASQCASVEEVGFHWLEVRRCFVQKRK